MTRIIERLGRIGLAHAAVSGLLCWIFGCVERSDKVGAAPVLSAAPQPESKRRKPHRGRRRITVVAVAGAAVLITAIGAIAYWTTTGTGSASASVGTLNAPTGITASASGSTVHVYWTAPASPSVAPTGYYVTRNDGTTTSAACGSSAGSPLTATPTNCDDTSVPSGTYTYKVTAVYHSWTATSDPSSSVTVAAAIDHFAVTAPASATAGSPFSVTVIAQDASDNTVTTYSGTVHFASSDPGSPVLPSNYTFVSGDGGSHTFTNGITLKTTPSQTVAVNDTVQTTKSGQATVPVTPATATTFTVSGYPSPTVAGVSHLFAVTAKDQFGNTDSNYVGTVHFTATNDAQAVLPTNSTLTAGSGSFSATFKTVAGGTKTLTATDTVTSSITGSQSGITVIPAAATTLTVAGFPSSTGGVAGTFTVTAKDAFNNTATGYTGTVHFTSSDAQATLPADYTFLTGDAGTRSFSATLKTSGTQSITATDTTTGSINGSQSGISITAAATAKLAFITAPQTLTAGVSSGTVTVQRQDQFGNATTSGGPLTVALTSSSAGGSFRNTTDTSTITSIQIGGGNSSANFLYRDSVTGTPTITGANGSLTSATQVETVNAAAASTLVFTTSPQTVTAGVASGTITVQRQDQFNNPVSSSSTTVNLSTTATTSGVFRDTGDLLDVTQVAILDGSSTGSFKYKDIKVGTPTITGASGSLTSATQSETVTAAAASKLVFTTSTQTVVVGQTSGMITVQRRDQFSNPTTLPAGAITVTLASSSGGGLFRDATDTSTITSIPINSGATSADFKYKDSQAGSPVITGSSSGLTDATQTATVNKASTTTTVSSSGSPSVFGQSVTLTATVAAVSPGAGTPSGTVNFKDGATTIGGCGTQALSGGSATCVTNSLSVGSHTTITAVYSSDTNFSASTSANFTQTVNKASTTTTVSSSGSPSVFGQSVTLTATVAAVSPGAGTPSGTVNFRDAGTTIGSCGTQALSGGSATCVTSSLSVGSHTTITAVYASDTNFSASASASLTQTVNKASTTTAVVSGTDPSVTGQSVTFTATVAAVAPGAGTPSGTVAFKDGATTITGCSASTLASGSATCVTTSLTAAASPHAITAVYAGDGNFLTSTSSSLTQTVNTALTSASVTSSSNPSVTGQLIGYTATVTATSPGGGTPTGSVEFFDAGVAISACGGTSGTAVNGSGNATCSPTYNTVGSHTITVQYLGDANYNASAVSASITQTVNKAATSTVLTSSADPSVTGQSVTFTATVSASSPGSGTPSGTVNFTAGGTTITSCGTQTLSGGVATCTTSYNASGGNRTISAVYSSDTNYLASTAANITQTVNKAATSTVVTSSVNPSVTGQSVTFTATVSANSPGAGTPAGTVAFKDGLTTIAGCGTQTLNAGGQATCLVSYNASGGSHSITAVYAVSSDYSTSTATALSQTVNKAATSTVVTSSTNPVMTGQSVTYTATISVTTPGSGAPSGTVNFTDNGTTITGCGTQAVTGSGPFTATCTTTHASAGSHPVVAAYSGDPNFSTSSSAAFAETVNIFAGIDFSNTSGGTFGGCIYTTITAVTCTATGVGGGNPFSAKVRLIDASYNAVTNNSGTGISVTATWSGQATAVTPTSSSVANGSSTSSSAFSITMNTGNKTATMTGTVTLNGATYTVTVTVTT